MVVIRLARGGAKKRPFYTIVVADKRRSRDGKFIEKLGFYNVIARGQEISLSLNASRYQHWVAQGAQPSDRVASLFKLSARNDHQDLPARLEKISKKPTETVKPESKSKKVEEAVAVEAAVAEAVATEEVVAEEVVAEEAVAEEVVAEEVVAEEAVAEEATSEESEQESR